MAIELITGLPGHGKTLYTISRYKEIAEKDARPVYYHGIKDLKLPWVLHAPEKWEELPPNAVFIIDEAWQPFPLRGRGSPDEWIQRLAVHRHQGIDIVLIAQDPLLIDSFVRRLCDRHRHVVRKFGTHFATVHEYANGVRDRVAQSRGDSIKHEWRYPKEAFEWYHSAEVHTVKRRIPMRVWVLLVMPVIAIALGWIGVQRLLPKDAAEAVAAQKAKSGKGKPPAAQPAQAQQGKHSGPMSVVPYLEMHQPRIAGLAYTAPVYDEVTKPVDAPYPAACVANDDRCQCYTQQATRLDVPSDLCKAIAGGGFFVAWRPAQPQKGADLVRSSGTAAPVQAVAPVAVPGGVHAWHAGEQRAGLLAQAQAVQAPADGGQPAPVRVRR